MLDHLRKHHDISTETLYPNRRIQESGDTEFYKGLTFQGRANSAETVLEREKWYKEAIEQYTAAIALAPENAEVYIYRGHAYYYTGDFAAAFADFNTAIALAPEDAWFYSNRGLAYRYIGDFAAALADFNKAIALAPEDAYAYCNRGEAGLHRKAWQNAKADLTAAKDMGIDIGAFFQNEYKSVEDFETKNEVKVPEDIAALFQGK